MKWEILILTQPSRSRFLSQLLEILAPQVAAEPTVKLTLGAFNTTMNLGDNREHMRKRAQGDYISFVDDDDFVHPHFVKKILAELHSSVDQVSFEVQIYKDGQIYGTAHHSLKHNCWRDHGRDFFRDISHVHPMRRELALQVPMEGGVGEDFRWAQKMRGRVFTEHHIHEVLYYYLWRTRKKDEGDHQDPARLQLFQELKK